MLLVIMRLFIKIFPKILTFISIIPYSQILHNRVSKLEFSINNL